MTDSKVGTLKKTYSDWLRPTVHPAYARLLCAHLRNKQIPMELVFKSNSLDWQTLLDTQRFISFEQFRRMALNAIEITECPWLGLEISSMIQVSAHGPLGYGAVAAQTVRQAFKLVEKALGTRIGLFEFEFVEERPRAQFILKEKVELGELREFIGVMLLGSFQDMLAKTSGSATIDIEVRFPFEEPEWLDQYKMRFPGIVFGFSSDDFIIDLPSELLDYHCLTADEFAYRNAVRECEQLLALHEGGGELSEQVKQVLFGAEGVYPSQEVIASQFGMSVRTLIRKLKTEGTSYQALLDEVRKELACWYLQNSEMSIERIAETLGFADTSNFSRVFRRWMDCKPSEFRKVPA